MDKIKNTAIPYSGYAYQTLQGMAWLMEWLAAPTRFLKMKFECSVKSEAPQGIDDIVAWRADGRVDYAQVKFTPNTENNPLTWDWLLDLPDTKKPRSLVMKWLDAVNAVSDESRGRVVLITNRLPDEQFGRCLAGQGIAFDKLSVEIVEKLTRQLGDEAAVRKILNVLEIRHSDLGLFAPIEY